MNTEKGFTLVELVLAAGIMALIGLTIASTLTGGLNIFYRMKSYTTTKADTLISMEKMERDIRNTFSYADIGFAGGARRVTFPGLIRTLNAEGLPEESIGSISYYLDDRGNRRMLSREDKEYALAIKEESDEKGSITPLAVIEDIKFRYYVSDPDSGSHSWVDSWDEFRQTHEDENEPQQSPRKGGIPLKDRKDDIPLGVRIEVSYMDGGRVVQLNRNIFIQPAVSLNLAKAKAAEKFSQPGAIK